MLERACYFPLVSVLVFACRVGCSRVRVRAGVLGVSGRKYVLSRRVGRVMRVGRVERVERAGGDFEPKHQRSPSRI